MSDANKGKAADSRTIYRKAVAGLAALLIILLVLVFVPVGTLIYWRGWAFILSFAVSVTLVSLYFLKTDIY
jgi:hypothetical protein